MATKKTTATRKRRDKKNIERGTVHIQSTFNNTIWWRGSTCKIGNRTF